MRNAPGSVRFSDCRKSQFSARYCFELVALRPQLRRRARYGNVAISCRKRREIGEKFHRRAAVAMTAGGSRPSLTEARAETAMAKQGTAIRSK